MEEKKLGRPKIEIDLEDVAGMCRIQCTRDEICDVLRISEDTLSRRIQEEGYEHFAAFYKRHQAGGKKSLRRMQWQSAEEGSVPMRIFLGKVILGQRENIALDYYVKEIPTMNIQILDTEKDFGNDIGKDFDYIEEKVVENEFLKKENKPNSNEA